MFPHHYATNKGQVLLITVVTVSVIGIVIASSLILLSFGSLEGAVISRQSAEANSLNNACAERALYLIGQNGNYTGSDSVVINNLTCNFTVYDLGGDQRQIDIEAVIGSVTRRSRIDLTVNPLVISSWQDIP